MLLMPPLGQHLVSLERHGHDERQRRGRMERRQHHRSVRLQRRPHGSRRARDLRGVEERIAGRDLAERVRWRRLAEQHDAVRMKQGDGAALADVDRLDEAVRGGWRECRDDDSVEPAVSRGQPPSRRDEEASGFGDRQVRRVDDEIVGGLGCELAEHEPIGA